MVKITGAREVEQRLLRMGAAGAGAKVGEVLFAAGQKIEDEAAISMTRGRAEVVDKKNHIASKPGEPPAVLYGDLRRSLETVQVSPVLVEVSADDPKAPLLEYGTSKMAERPFMRPAVANTAEERRGLWRQLAAWLVQRGG